MDLARDCFGPLKGLPFIVGRGSNKVSKASIYACWENEVEFCGCALDVFLELHASYFNKPAIHMPSSQRILHSVVHLDRAKCRECCNDVVLGQLCILNATPLGYACPDCRSSASFNESIST